MKQLMLAAVASIALSLPAMAQSNNTNSMQPNRQSQMGSQAQSEIDPSQLNRQQIRHIQTSLDQKGFNVGHVDGKWGPRTEAALKNFQQKQNLEGNGQLDQRTLGALGVNVNGQMQQGAATTGSGSNENRVNQPGQNPGRLQNDNTSTKGQTNGLGSSSSSGGQSSPHLNNQTNGSGAIKGSSPNSSQQ
jgi:peptidoglycan hydrolase-like protein with peptidoglycan-binding domain